MVTKAIKFTNYNGEEKTKTCYFALSKTDMVLLNAKYGDLAEYTRKCLEKDREAFFTFLIDDIIVRSYGQRSEDGDSFIKKPEDAVLFRYSPACDELLIELLADEEGANVITFLKSIVPPDVGEAMDKAAVELAVNDTTEVVTNS